jgi:hypothetical protein
VAKRGKYVCEGTVDLRPLGRLLKGKVEVDEKDWNRKAQE